MQEVMEIRWQGPYTFEKLLRTPDLNRKEKFGRPGVYLRIETPENKDPRLAYVGKAIGSPTLYQRQIRHYFNMISGRYMIPKDFRKNGQRWSPSVKADGRTVDVLLDRDRYLELVEEAFTYAQACLVYFFPAEKEICANLERNLLWQFQPTMTKNGTKSKPVNGIDFVHVVADRRLETILRGAQEKCPGKVDSRVVYRKP